MRREDIQQELLELLPDAVVIVDQGGHIVIVNSPAESMFDYSRAELLGQPLEILIPERFRERHVQQHTAYLARPHVRPLRNALSLFGRRRDGSEFPVDIMLSPMAAEDGGLVMSVIRDATERKQVEETLRQQRDELVEAYSQLRIVDEIQSQFIANASHELRTPVANVHLYLNLLTRGKPDKQPHYLEILNEQAARLLNLVDDLTDVSHLGIDNLMAIVDRVDLNAVANQVVASLQSYAAAGGLDLTFSPAPTLLPVRVVRHRLSQVVANLVSNAIRYTAEGQVQVRTYRSQDSGCLEVQDTGPGIDPEDMPHLFNRFYRGHRVRHLPGTGLGLAVAREIASLHGGTVEAENLSGGGSRFTVRLPLDE